MRVLSTAVGAVATVGVLIGTGLAPAEAGTRIEVVELGAEARIHDLNDAGQVIGSIPVPGQGSRPFRWQHGRLTVLPGPPGSWAESINDRGRIVGFARSENGPSRALLWQDGTVRELLPGVDAYAGKINERGQVLASYAGGGHVLLDGTQAMEVRPPGEAPSSVAVSLGDGGHVVGGEVTGSISVGFAWHDGKLSYLADPAEIPYSLPYAVNARGQVVGDAIRSTGSGDLDSFAFRWENGEMTRLGTLGGRYAFVSKKRHAINQRGQVVGMSQNAQEEMRPFLWTRGRMTDLGTFGGKHGEAAAVNDHGDVAGSSQDAAGNSHAFLWRDGKLTPLPVPPGFTTSSAYAINNQGMVTGVVSNGTEHREVLWTTETG
ncbi:HAF repeat-containing protein [Amycolatopsis nigrescens]|uniref:HAF repeat-containing protein n=1 Tax=Amycolatopsis nigrescens TaxID=381445 RepID=UPI00036B52B0|nr:HAF repeat-containing protein [Amycolatopsis nigrescens]